jgi:hypothetical protein
MIALSSNNSSSKLEVSGNANERNDILRYLQVLSRDNLTAVEVGTGLFDGNRRWVVNYESVDGNEKNTGTMLIRYLIDGGDIDHPETLRDHITSIQMVSREAENSARPRSSANSRNRDIGTGTRIRVTLDISQNLTILEQSYEDRNGEIQYRSSYGSSSGVIILGHELIHAYRNLRGIRAEDTIVRNTVTLPEGTRHTFEESLEELQTIGIRGDERFTENALRAEQNMPRRLTSAAIDESMLGQ